MIRTALRRAIAPSLLISALVAPAEAAPALWAASDGDSTVYLFGTSHVVRPGAKWRTPELDAALASSTALWLEVQTGGAGGGSASLVQKLGLDPITPLESRLTPALKTKLEAVLAQYGMPAARLAPMKPWLAAMTIAMLPLAKAGLDPKSGADVTLRGTAQAEGDRIEGFDTPEEQLRYVTDLSDADQLAFLENVLDRAAGGVELPNRIADAWEAGDVKAIDSILNSELKAKTPTLYRRLIVDRNRRYAERIKTLLSEKENRLVAIGVGHLVGPNSVRAMLKRKGVKIRRIR